jgi:ADP-ribosyl-[dinitrogen reductase] hydrolase
MKPDLRKALTKRKAAAKGCLMLLNMAVADAYAIPFEFIDKSEYPGPNDLKTYHKHPKYHELKLGQYTDDTQRSIANWEVMVMGDWTDTRAFAQKYVDVFARDPREGYSRGYQKLLRDILLSAKAREENGYPDHEAGMEFLRICKRSKNSNGAVMGAAVLGLMSNPEHVKIAAMVQACTTHLPHTAIHAQIVALAAHYTAFDIGPKDEIQTWVMQTIEDGAFRSQEELTNWYAECENSVSRTRIAASSISAFVIGAIRRHTTMSGILREAVDRGGDTDSAAAAAIAVASHCAEIEDDLPVELFDGLERGQWGFDFLKELDNDIAEFVEEQCEA